MTYQLQITPSVGRSWLYRVDQPLIKIGRATHCEVVVNDPLVSREHCLLQIKPEGVILEDLSSANGTLVNDTRITRTALQPGDKIRLGLSELVLESVPEKEVSPPTRPASAEAPKKEEIPTGEPTPVSPALPSPPPVEAQAPPAAPAEIIAVREETLPLPLFSPNQEPPVILVAHPECSRIEGLLQPLSAAGARLVRAAGIEEIRRILNSHPPDCVLLCPNTEKAAELCQEIRSHPKAGPVVLLLREKNWAETVSLFRAGAEEILPNPDPQELLVRVRNMLELRRLRQETAATHAQVEKRVSDDVISAERISRLKRYLSPQVVAAVLSGDESHVLKPTRQEVSIVFSDLRNYTQFSEASEPEEIIAMLKDFHALYGEIIFQYDGTLERFAGDGVMVFFGAPVPFQDHACRAVAMAVNARERLKGLRTKWEKLGYSLDISFGISTGYVYVGNIGFEGRMDYAAIGKTTNLAARLCAAAKGGQILISRKTLFQVEDLVEVEEIGALEVKGFSHPVLAYDVLRLKSPYTPAPML